MNESKTMTRILITGGCGFIGSELVKKLIEQNYRITIIDNLIPQVHGKNPHFEWLENKHITFIKGNICNRKVINELIREQDIIVHLAAETGTAQSMYEIHHCSEVNILGTANIADALINEKNAVRKIILSSSRAVYGEGKYNCPVCGTKYPGTRKFPKTGGHSFEPLCPSCGRKLVPIPTDENSFLKPSSIYGMSKLAQENIISIACRAKKIPYTILRFQNVYGEGQSLHNPYTGILPVFISQIMQKKQILLFEDGLETRDFIHVSDAVSAILLSLMHEQANDEIFNVGSGEARSVLNIAEAIFKLLHQTENYKITYQYREGDIRHNLADISHIHEKLGFLPSRSFENGLEAFIAWAMEQPILNDHFEKSINFLKGRGLYSR